MPPLRIGGAASSGGSATARRSSGSSRHLGREGRDGSSDVDCKPFVRVILMAVALD
jgi:hypothetical protein